MKILNIILLLSVAVLLMNCSDRPDDTEVQKSGNNSPKAHQESKGSVLIYPDEATVETVISLTTDSSAIPGSAANWYINDVQDESARGAKFISERLRKGDTVKAVIVADGKEYPSNEITIKNTPPAITRGVLLPSSPKLNSTLSVELKARDIDDDRISFRYEWTVNDTFAGENNYLNFDLKRDDTVTVEITPYDDEGPGKPFRLTTTILNSLPVFTESEPVFDGKTYTYQMRVTDPDNDTLAYTLEKGPEGMKVDPESGLITWEVSEKDKGSHEVSVRVSDNQGGELIIPFTTRIAFEETPS